jgi:peptidoglycan-associated lipoprotein
MKAGIAVMIGISALMFSACAHKGIKSLPGSATVLDMARTQNARPPVQGGLTEASAQEPSVRAEEMHSVADLANVYFDFDKALLNRPARATLEKNSGWLKAHEDVKIQVSGNCDQRGTTEYNMALGQRRAEAVRDYYGYLGIDRNRIATISYGKEKPVCREEKESCWSQNRRAETLVSTGR